jgi:hypothetical protein
MIFKFFRVLSFVLVLALLQSCSLVPAGLPNGQSVNNPPTATPAPFVAETDGPPSFSAVLAAPDIVALSWTTVADAVGYKLQIVFNGLDPLTIAYLPKAATSFTHYLAPESSMLTYRLQTITASGPAGASSLQIATQGHAPNPLAVQAAFSGTGTASAVIGPAGGTLETTDARGVIYTLVIPPQALDADLEIKMTPVSTIDGWPLDGHLLGGVRLEPEGWLLNELAYLTIRVPAAQAPKLTTVGFAFTGTGEEFHLTQAYPGLSPLSRAGTGGSRLARPASLLGAGVFNLPIMELRTAGLGATGASAAAALALKNAPTDSRDAADQKAALADVEDILTPLPDLRTPAQKIETATDNLMNQILNDVHDCYDFKRAVGAFQAWESKMSGYGDASLYGGARDTLLQQLADKALETIESSSAECVKAPKGVVPASIPCAERLTRDIESGSTPFYAELQNTMTKTPGMTGRLSAAAADAKKCPHSYGVNSASTMGLRWTSACIPSLDRPYHVAWIGLNSNGEWWLFPSDPFSGRLEGQSQLDVGGGATGSLVYTGTYEIKVTKEDIRGYPVAMDANLSYSVTTTMCTGSACTSFTDTGTDTIPLLVNKQRCPIP